MLVVPDNDIEGCLAVIRHILESTEWVDYLNLVGARFVSFQDLGILHDAPDEEVWQRCQSVGAILVTGNRAGGADSLDAVIRRHAGADSLPVVTLARPQRLLRDRNYARAAAIKLLDYLERIESLRGVGRLFLP
jgi:hypothetical protein